MQTTHDYVKILNNETSKNPIEILRKLMALPPARMHGPEHHVMVGSALLCAYKNAGGKVELNTAYEEIKKRAEQVPGGACGLWGSCGAGVSTGMFVSIVTGATPLSGDIWCLPNKMTAAALDSIGSVGGPRCCKRDSYLAIKAAVKFIKDNFGVKMELGDIKCIHSHLNEQCIGERCPFI